MRLQTTSTEKSRHPLYRMFLCSVVLLGLGVYAFSLYRVFQNHLGYEWIILASLTLLTASFTLKIPGTISKISVAEIFIVINLLLFGPAVGCITAGLDGLLGSIRCKTRSRRLQFMLFNMAVMGLSAFGAGEAFTLVARRPLLFRAEGATLEEILVPLACLALVYYLINTLAVAAVIGLDSQQSIYQVWRKNFLWLSPNFAMAAITAGLLVLATPSITPAVVATILAILVSSYFTCRNYLLKAANIASASGPNGTT